MLLEGSLPIHGESLKVPVCVLNPASPRAGIWPRETAWTSTQSLQGCSLKAV